MQYFLHSYDSVIEKARHLRKRMTPEEKILWTCLRRHALGVHFRKQVPFGPYILDFFCVPARIAIELDGSHHYSAEGKVYDNERDAYLRSFGITVLRFPNRRIRLHPDEVIDLINAEIQKSDIKQSKQSCERSIPDPGVRTDVENHQYAIIHLNPEEP